MKLTPDIVKLAKLGASIEVDAKVKLTPDLIAIAKAVSASGGALRLYNCNSKLTPDLEAVVKAAPGRVTLVF